MKKHTGKNLSLKVESVRVLGTPELDDVAGGKQSKHCPTVTCPPVTTWMTCPR